MNTPHTTKRHPQPVVSGPSKHVVVSMGKVRPLDADRRKKLEAAARDPKHTERRLFPAF